MKKNINEGGINGLGEGLINTNSEEFKALQSMIRKASSHLDKEQLLENKFLSIRFQMESYINSTLPEHIIPAGAFLEQFINALNIKKKDFAKYVEFEESNLSALLKGRRKLNTDLAIKLGRIFKLDPVIWLHIENKNNLLIEHQKNEQKYARYTLYDLLKKVS